MQWHNEMPHQPVVQCVLSWPCTQVLSKYTLTKMFFFFSHMTLVTSTDTYNPRTRTLMHSLIHNIPMGMSIAMPVYAGTGSWKKAMGLCTVAAFAQPLGSLVAYGALGENLSMLFEGAMYSMLAGILLFVALIELLPNAYGLSTGSRALPGLFTFLGMGVMASDDSPQPLR